ncbi:MAG: OmpA family protein [Dermatophilaceae bacterium]
MGIAHTALAPALVLSLAACSAAIRQDDQRATGSTTSSSSPIPVTRSAPVSAPEMRGHVPGYAYGQFPPVPLFTLPDLAILDTSLSGFGRIMAVALKSVPGVTVSPNSCDEAGRIHSDDAGIVLYGDGSGRYTGPDGRVVNYGDGSGSYTLDGTEVVVNGDGSGSYTKESVRIVSYGDGSGTYEDGTVAIRLHGDGSGSVDEGVEHTTNFGDGSGTWTDGTVSIRNFGDGSGTYESPNLAIRNHGDGTGTVNGTLTTLEPIGPVPRLGTFPKMGVIKPVKACAITVSMPDDSLFEVGRSDLRPESAQALASVAAAIRDSAAASAEVQGHSDSIGSDSDNQALSERRARAVVDALQWQLPAVQLKPLGYGGTRPVVPNTVGGHDNAAGRQRNRRVDIVIPLSGATR